MNEPADMRRPLRAITPPRPAEAVRLPGGDRPHAVATREINRDLRSPALFATYSRLPAGEGSTTDGAAVGVAFTPQTRAVWDVAGAGHRERRLGASSVFVAPSGGIEWLAWSDVSESVEMWVPAALLRELSIQSGGPARPVLDYVDAAADPVVVNVAGAVRSLILGAAPADQLRQDELATLLGGHVLRTYAGVPVRIHESSRAAIDAPVLRAIAEYVDAHLDRPIALRELAALARRDLYHFARAFRRATGTPPHAFVTARRMERALVLLHQTTLPVAEVARRVGYSSVGHFRRQFTRTWGVGSGEFRRSGRPRRAVAGVHANASGGAHA